MAVQIVDPNGDGATSDWTEAGSPGGGSSYQFVDNGVRQPSTDSIDTDYLTSQTNAQVEIHSMGTFTASAITQVKVWIRCKKQAGDGENVNVSVYMGGGWEADQALDPTTSWSWRSLTYSGSWNQSDLNALEVRFTMVRPTGGSAEISEHYAEITYTGGATSRSHFV